LESGRRRTIREEMWMKTEIIKEGIIKKELRRRKRFIIDKIQAKILSRFIYLSLVFIFLYVSFRISISYYTKIPVSSLHFEIVIEIYTWSEMTDGEPFFY